jgi:sigma-B regulation protein RsbU (phosphoserine phosphatase)
VGQSIRALLVDDDPMLLALLAAFIESRGYAVEQSHDGADALERVRAGSFNLLITDRNMPRMDGLTLCREVRALGLDNYVYSIMLTASDDEKSLVAAMEAGVDDFLAKPLRPAELGARLRAAERVLALEAQMAARNRELSDAYGQLRHDLEMARTLQLSQLPPPQDLGGISCEGMFEASSFVGGDTYDYFPLGEDLVVFYLADVSGHGVAAAMLAVAVQHRLRTAAIQVVRALGAVDDPGAAAVRIVTELNRRFLQTAEEGMYLTLAFGLLHRPSGRLALVHAGHPPSLVAAPGDAGFAPVGEPGVPIGVLDDPGFEAATLAMPAGSRIVLYTDGITDCAGPGGELFGDDRLRAVLARERSTPPGATGSSVRDALRAWHGGAFEDDVTLVVVESR